MADQIVNANVAGQVSNEIAAKAREAKPFAVEMARADATFEMIVEKTATSIARVLGTEPTYVLWNQVSYEFRAAYMDARKCASRTADNRWSDVVKYLEKLEQKKPAAPSVAADKKAKERAAFDKKVKAAKAQFVKPADALEKAAALAKEGKINEAKVVQAAAVQLQASMIKDAKKQAKETISKAKEALRDAIGKCDDAALLAQALAVLKGGKLEDSQAQPKAPRKVSGKKEEVKA